MDILARILRAIEDRGYKQSELADYLGLHRNNITDWKSGKSKSYTKYLPQIADFLGVSIDYLIGKSEIPSPDLYTIDKIIFLLEEKGIQQKQLADFLGISKNTITDWKSGRIKSYNKYLPQIAEFLGVSVDHLLGKKEKSANDGGLSENRRKLIQFVETVPDDKAELVLRVMKSILEDD